MRHPAIKIIGNILIALIAAGLVFTVVAAALAGKLWYGVNYKGLDLGVYTTLGMFAMVAIIGAVWLAQRGLRVLRRQTPPHPPTRPTRETPPTPPHP